MEMPTEFIQDPPTSVPTVGASMDVENIQQLREIAGAPLQARTRMIVTSHNISMFEPRRPRHFINVALGSNSIPPPLPPLRIKGLENQKLDVLKRLPRYWGPREALGVTFTGMVWIRSRIFRAPKSKHIIYGRSFQQWPDIE